MIVQSCHDDFNLKRLERYLVMVRDGGADPYVLLTKTDLVEPEVPASRLAEIRAAGVAAPVLPVSNVTQEGIDDLKRTLRRAPARRMTIRRGRDGRAPRSPESSNGSVPRGCPP
jgi:ribosome biogenesis GTPase